MNRWVEENKHAHAVRAMTVAAPKYDGIQSCVAILHHIRKGTQPVPRRAPLDATVAEEPHDV